MRVVIADDAPLIREGVARLLTENGVEVVDRVGDADAVLESVRDLHPDVALVDIRMPPTHTDEGLRAAREIRLRYPDTAVLVLSQHLEPDYALQLVEEKPEGVGYLMKERVGRIEQLLEAVQRVAAGECVVDRAVVDELLARRRLLDPIGELTSREREILALIAKRGADPLDRLFGLHVVDIAAADRPRLDRRCRITRPRDVLFVEAAVLPGGHCTDVERCVAETDRRACRIDILQRAVQRFDQ